MSRAKKAAKNRRTRKQQPNTNDNSQQLQKAMNWVINQRSFKDLDFQGNTSWQPADLIVLTLLWIWSREDKLTAAFDEARSQACGLYGKAALTTYQGLAGTLETWTATFMPLLILHLHTLIEQMDGRHLRVGRWVPIAVDGSRATTPRTKSNEKAFCTQFWKEIIDKKHQFLVRVGGNVRLLENLGYCKKQQFLVKWF